MAVSAKRGKGRVVKKVLHYFIVVNLVSHLVPCWGSLEFQSQAFLNGGKDELYSSGRSFQESLKVDSSSFNSGVFFYPPYLDYGIRPIGMPFVEQIVVQNADPQMSLHLLSISGSSPHFHCSFFEDKLVAPLGNTTFEVCFLAQNLGQIKTTLYIHSSRGSFKYQVSGDGIENPYRIKPFLGARVPLNSSFSPVIHLHNPHESVLQVQEVYSSGSDLHLELPSGQVEATKELWEIPPYTTKPIMKANFVGRVENNHTVFIRIKTNKENKQEMLVVPVEVEVTSDPGLFSTSEMLDFGILRTFDDDASLRLNLINSQMQPMQIINVTVEPVNEAVYVDFVPVHVRHDIVSPTTVAIVTFQASKADSNNNCSGSIVVQSSDPLKKLVIPYQAQVFFGFLGYEKNSTNFYSHGSNENVERAFLVKNMFKIPLVIFNVTLKSDAINVFSVLNFSRPLLIEPDRELYILTLLFHSNVVGIQVVTEMVLHTNLSQFKIPLTVYNGRLQVWHQSVPLNGHLNFGTLAVEERRTLNFTVINDNPIDIKMSRFNTTFDGSNLKLVSIESLNGSDQPQLFHQLYSLPEVLLQSFHKATFSLEVDAPKIEETLWAEAIVETQNEILSVPFTLQTTFGSLQIDPGSLTFHECFPGKVTTAELRINSSFQSDLMLRDILFNPNDSKFSFTPYKVTTISANQESTIGKIAFDPLKGCADNCYSVFPTHVSAGRSWLFGMTLDDQVVETDVLLFSRAKQKWNSLVTSEKKIVNITMQLNTNHVQGFLFHLQAHLHWPSLIKQTSLVFPLTQIGNISTITFSIENPSNLPVLIHIVPASSYPNVGHLLNSIGPFLLPTDDPSQFDPNVAPPISISNVTDVKSQTKIKSLDYVLGIHPSKNSTVLFVKPRKKVAIQLSFEPKNDNFHSSYFIIRNNVTLVELLKVEGRGGIGEIRFSNRKPGSNRPLMFEMNEKHMKSCESYQSRSVQPNFVIKRTFTLRNMGQLPVYVHSFEISGRQCEGYGFRVLDCSAMMLSANESRKINIIFTPDFTMAKVRQMLVINTNLMTSVEYMLHVVIPSHMLAKCAASLPRPAWEPILFYCIIVMMGFLIVCIVMAAYYESNRIFAMDLQNCKAEIADNHFDKSKVFDLRIYSSSDYVKSLTHHKKLNCQDVCCNSIQEKITSAPETPKPLSKPKTTKLFFNLLHIFCDIFQKVKFVSSASHSRQNNEKRRDETRKVALFRFFSLLFKTNVNHNKEEITEENQRKEDSTLLSSCKNSTNHKVENDTILTLRKVDRNKKQKNLPSNNVSSNKALEAFFERDSKVTNKIKQESSSKTCKPKDRKISFSEVSKTPEKGDDLSSTDTSSVDNDEKNVTLTEMTELSCPKKNKIKHVKTSQFSSKPVVSSTESSAQTSTSFPIKSKVKKTGQVDGDDATSFSKLSPTNISPTVVMSNRLKTNNHLVTNNNKVKTTQTNNTVRNKKKMNGSGLLSTFNERLLSKSPSPTWDHPISDVDNLSEIVEQTDSFAKLRKSSLSPDKHLSHVLFPSIKPVGEKKTNLTEASNLPNTSTSGGRPVAAVGATVRRPWNQSVPVISRTDNPISSFSYQTNSNHDADSSNLFIFPNNNHRHSDSHMLGDFSNFRSATQNMLEPLNDFPQSKERQATAKLLDERRKRLMEYFSENWSGLPRNQPVAQQPWTSNSNPWPVRSYQEEQTRSSSLAERYNLFGPRGVWGSNNNLVNDDGWPSWRTSDRLFGPTETSTYSVFDPFNTLENNGSIWNPTSTGSSINNGWDYRSAKSPQK